MLDIFMYMYACIPRYCTHTYDIRTMFTIHACIICICVYSSTLIYISIIFYTLHTYIPILITHLYTLYYTHTWIILLYLHIHSLIILIHICIYIGTDYVNEAPEQYFEDMITTCQSIMTQLSSLKDSFLKSSAYLPINKANLHHLTDLTSIDAFRKQGQNYDSIIYCIHICI